jgi:hypothetical protein
MADILSMLGLSGDDWQKRAKEAQEKTEKYIDGATHGVGPEMPSLSNLMPAKQPDFFNDPQYANEDERFQAFRKYALENKGYSDPVTGQREQPNLGPEKFEEQILATFGRKKDRDATNLANKQQKETDRLAQLKQKYDETVAKYAKLGLTPPAMPAELAAGGPDRTPAVLPPAEIPQDGSIFGAVSQKYQDLQKEGRVGAEPGKGGGGGPAAQKANVAPKDSKGKPEDGLQTLLNKLYGDDLSDDALSQAQGAKNQKEMIAMLSRGLQQVVGGLSRGAAKADTESADIMFKNAGSGVQDILTRRDAKQKAIETGIKASDLQNAEKLRDPGSAVSEAYRNMALQLNPKLAGMAGFDSMNAAGIKELIPMIDASIRAELVKEQRESNRQSKQEDRITKELNTFNRGIDSPYTARSGTALGRAANAIRQAEAIQAFTYSGNDLNKLTSAQINELAAGVDFMIRGSTAVGSIKKLVPSNINMTASDLMSWVTSEPQGAKQKKFVELLLKSSEREKQVAEHQIKDYQAKWAAQSARNLKGVPEFENALSNRGLTELYEKALKGDKIDSAGEYVQSLKNQVTQGAAPPGKVKVTNKKTGETFFIDPSDVPNAKADGFEPG